MFLYKKILVKLIPYGIITAFFISYSFISFFIVWVTHDSPTIPVDTSVIIKSTSPVIIIDPGHGGIDGGAVSESGIVEKEINLKIGTYLKALLELSDFDVFITRSEDKMLGSDVDGSPHSKRDDLLYRVKFTKQFDEYIFISIHQNNFTSSKYKGLQVFYAKNDPESKKIAQMITSNNKKILDRVNSRECKPAGREIMVLDKIGSNAVLVECGFLSNAKEAEMLNSELYQKQIAFMLYKSITEYLHENKSEVEK